MLIGIDIGGTKCAVGFVLAVTVVISRGHIAMENCGMIFLSKILKRTRNRL